MSLKSRCSYCLFLALALAVPASAATKKIHGFVTNVISPTAFEIDDYKITRDITIDLEIEKEDDEQTAKFAPEEIRVGTELEIKGDYDEKTGELKAHNVKVFTEDSRTIKRTALLEKKPALTKAESGWAGSFFADGQTIKIVPATKVQYQPTKRERKLLKKGESEEFQPLENTEQLGPDFVMHYEGKRQTDGSIAADKLVFARNELEDGELKLWRQLEPKVKQPDFTSLRPGEVKIRQVGGFKLVPNAEAQAYIQRLGTSLVPKYLQNTSTKIPFRFYLVDQKIPNAFALANGVVVVHSSMFDVLENEAQLAAVMGHEIAHSIQRHTWRQQQYHKKSLTALHIGAAFAGGMGYGGIANIANMVEGAIRNGYSRSLENQADRLGMEYMLDSGYDIREAPRVWKVMAMKLGDHPTNFFWDNHDNDMLRRSYLMSELRNNYSDVDYSLLKKDGEFNKISEIVRQSAKGHAKVKVKF